MRKFNIKNLILILVFIINIVSISAQKKEDKETSIKKKNELKVDVFDLLAFTAIELNYERVQNNEIGYGVSVFVNFKSENTYHEKFAVTPFFRYYFTSNEDFGAKGFFVEAFSKFASGDAELLDIFSDKEQKYFDIAMGVALGRKWINHKGFTFETSWGVGRNFGIHNNSPSFVLRGGVSLGYRF